MAWLPEDRRKFLRALDETESRLLVFYEYLLYFLIVARPRRMVPALVFGAIATVGPVAWLVYNRWFCLDALAFYRGPYSAKAIQGGIPYPGNGDWQAAILYFGWAVRACAGAPLFFMGIAGALAWNARPIGGRPVFGYAAALLLVGCSAFAIPASGARATTGTWRTWDQRTART